MRRVHLRVKPRDMANVFHIYSRLFRYVKRYWIALIVAILASILYSAVDSWFVYFLKPLLNEGLIAQNKSFLRVAPFLVMAVFILRGVASFSSSFFVAAASRNVIRDLRQDLFLHLQRLPARFYDHSTSGQILSVILYGVDQVANASADVLTTAIQAFFLVIGLIYVMIMISWKLTLLYFALVPIIAVIMRVTSLRIGRLSLAVQDSIGDISHHAEENIESYKVVRAFEGQAYETSRFNKATQINRNREMKMVSTRGISVATVQFIMAIALGITVYIASIDTTKSILSAGGFVAMMAAMLGLLKPMKDLAFVQNKFYRGVAGAQGVFELMDKKPEEDTGKRTLVRAQGKMQFSNVNFSYDETKEVLQDITFTVEPGEIVALVGRSGSGKSTLANLLPRFYHNFTGDILLDDVAIYEYTLQSLRRQFAIVSQNVTLFHDTIYNNIAYGRLEEASEAEINEAANASYAMEFIQKCPKGFDSLIGENGVLLSGGQRQRIAIARAILKNAPILILDEATSSLDTESERYIQAALEQLMKNRTTLVIAHRLSTVENANKIIVMDDGRIIEMGNHHELLELNGHYAKLYRMQFKESPHVLEAINNAG